MKVSELNNKECLLLTEGTGGHKMHVIKLDDKIYITQDDKEIKGISQDSSSEVNRQIYEIFSRMSGEKDDTLKVLCDFKKKARDFYPLLVCQMLLNSLGNENA